MNRLTAATTVLLFALGGGARAFADAEEAAHAKAVVGEEALAAKKYAEAARAFEDALRIHPLPMYQRKLGEALRGAGDCTRAIAALKAYFDKTKDTDVVREIQACREALARAQSGAAPGGDGIQVFLRQGRYDDARDAARKAVADDPKSVAARTTLAEVLLAMGREKDALGELEAALRLDEKAFHARLLLGTTLVARGERKRGRLILDKFFDFYNNDELKTASDLTDLAVAMKTLERWRDAHRVFGEAVKADKSYVRAHVEWGRLLLEKYNIGEAKQSFDDALKIDPDSPEAHVGRARALVDAYEIPKAFTAVEKALKTNTNHVEARSLLASLHLLSEDPDRALVEVRKALAVNARDRYALAVRAAAHYLADDKDAFERVKKRALKFRPKDAELFLTVASHASTFHRYSEAVALIEEGLKRDPLYWRAFAPLGQNYLRMGDEVKGRELLQKSWGKDPFNARTKNILDLYDDTIQHYRFALTPHFRVRFHKDDEKVLKRYVVGLLERAYNDMVARYGFKPRTPITVELFAKAEDFAVRTVGTPSLASLGVCFGRVVTSMSPRARRFNWGQVLWHELNHVFTLQASRARVPRWLTEGLAVFEEGKGHPQWAREMDARMYAALRRGKIRKILELNLGFTRARSIPEILMAYFQGAHAVMFLEEKIGLAGIGKLLRGFGEGKRLKELLPDVVGLAPERFDADFKSWLEKRFAHLTANFELDYSMFEELDALEKKASADDKNAQAWAELAAGRFRKRDVKGAEAAVAKALKADPAHPLANYVAGELALFAKREDDALGAYEKVLAAGKDGYDLRRSIALLYKRKKLTDKAREHLEQAKKRDPQSTEPHRILAEIYEQAGETDKAIAELEHVGRVDHKNARILMKLVRHFARKGEGAKVVEFGELALYLNPFDASLHFELGRALAAKGEGDRALAELQTALDSGHKDVADTHVEIAQIHLAAGRRAEANAAALEALKADANHARAKELSQQTKP
jgi:tetratricopeptide (TPR) repeat protein